MASDDCSRHTTWNEQDRTEFHTRLRRARKHNRPQYLRIQAAHLANAGLHTAALELLDQFFETEDNTGHMALAQLQRAESLLATGKEEAAIEAFRASLAAQRHVPNVQTEAWLQFTWFIVETENTPLYAEAESIVDEFSAIDSTPFPASQYRLHCIRTILLAHSGNMAEATVHAQKAIHAANATHSGFRYHPNLGLVHNTQTTVHQRVSEIASNDGDD